METEATLERRSGLFLLGMRGDQGGIDVEDQRMGFVDGVVGSRCAGSGPGVGSGGGAGASDRGERGVGVGGQHADQAGDGGIRGHRTEDLRVGSQLCDVGEAVPTDRQCRREIEHDLVGIVSGQRFSIWCEFGRQCRGEAGLLRGAQQQSRAGMGHDTGSGGRCGHAWVGGRRLAHRNGVPRTAADMTLDKSHLRSSGHHSLHATLGRFAISVKARG